MVAAEASMFCGWRGRAAFGPNMEAIQVRLALAAAIAAADVESIAGTGSSGGDGGLGYGGGDGFGSGRLSACRGLLPSAQAAN